MDMAPEPPTCSVRSFDPHSGQGLEARRGSNNSNPHLEHECMIPKVPARPRLVKPSQFRDGGQRESV